MGNRYYKSTDCGTCPKCEQANKPSEGLLSRLTLPARNALINAGTTELEQLAEYTEKVVIAYIKTCAVQEELKFKKLRRQLQKSKSVTIS